MSDFPRTGDADRPVMARPRTTIAAYADYGDAQRAVDFLSDNHFPVNQVTIVGKNLRLVERVTARMTVPRAALAGAGTGAWIGLLIGLLIGIFAVEAWLGTILWAVGIGIIWGAVFGAVAQALNRGQRDFASFRSIDADEYELMVDTEHAQEALDLLAKMP